MSQTIFDFRQGFALRDHPDGARVPEAMDRMHKRQSFGCQSLFKASFADAVDTMACQCRSSLVDEQIFFKNGRGVTAVPCNILMNKFSCFWKQFNLPVSVPLSEDSQGFVFIIKVIQLKCGDFCCPGSGII
ncbi:MAG: hypothetical protein U5K27_12450 [Desulfotignum sp.]|nr:hypothetical protein [Desulfotignum sp.]